MEDDGVQVILSLIINSFIDDLLLRKILITLWYIWKARNDQRFARKTWSTWQVHHAVAAQNSTVDLVISTEDEQGQTPPATSPHPTAIATGMNVTMQVSSRPNTGRKVHGGSAALLPEILRGTRCYTDASIAPDSVSSSPRRAGIGTFILNMQVHPPENIYIKATLPDSSSVLMAEAAAIALAAVVTGKLGLRHTNFLSDNQGLDNFFNTSDDANPPDWRIKHLTQTFINHKKHRSTELFKIPRNQISLLTHWLDRLL